MHSHERLDDEASGVYYDVSSRVVRSLVVSRVRATLGNRFRFCEIAAGPAVWSFFLLEEFSGAHGVVVCETDDLAEIMARRSAAGYEDRLAVVPVALRTTGDLDSATFDVSLSLDDVLDVSEEPAWILAHLVRITKPGGLVMTLVRNLCDAVSASLADANIEQAEKALTGKGRCVRNATELNLFSSQSIEALLKSSGAQPLVTVGVPAAAPPSALHAHALPAHSVSHMLSNGEFLERILRIEQALINQRPGAARGSHLLSIAAVPSRGMSWGDFWLTELEGGSPQRA